MTVPVSPARYLYWGLCMVAARFSWESRLTLPPTSDKHIYSTHFVESKTLGRQLVVNMFMTSSVYREWGGYVVN